MHSFIVTILAVILTLTTLSVTGQSDGSLNGSHVRLETIERLPNTNLEINSPNSSKSKLNVEFISQETFYHTSIDYKKEISSVHRYDFPNYNILRSKNYFLII
jgi:hypothetical protein